MLDYERTEVDVLVKIESRIVWVTEILNQYKQCAHSECWPGSGTNGAFLKQLFQKPKEYYKQQLKRVGNLIK